MFAKREAAKRPFRFDAQTSFACGPGAGDDKAITNAVLNVIPDNASAEFEVRFFDAAEGQRLDREIKALAEKTLVPGTKVSITGGIGTSPMEKTPQAQEVIDVYRGIVQRRFRANSSNGRPAG